ncbi:hypothetical protein [Vagococcus sp. WN89Y]|uniref:hypothetical protein n=1 Tax=Vagococcus sp. WN89Y TaxID=3457258 RepID=UPI003FCE9227
MFISWYWLLVIALFIAVYIHALKRSCKAYRQEREALQKGYQRMSNELQKLKGLKQGE